MLNAIFKFNLEIAFIYFPLPSIVARTQAFLEPTGGAVAEPSDESEFVFPAGCQMGRGRRVSMYGMSVDWRPGTNARNSEKKDE